MKYKLRNLRALDSTIRVIRGRSARREEILPTQRLLVFDFYYREVDRLKRTPLSNLTPRVDNTDVVQNKTFLF